MVKWRYELFTSIKFHLILVYTQSFDTRKPIEKEIFRHFYHSYIIWWAFFSRHCHSILTMCRLFVSDFFLKIAWLRVDTQTILTIQTHVITKNHRMIVTHAEKRAWQLKIRDVKETDKGWYMVSPIDLILKTEGNMGSRSVGRLVARRRLCDLYSVWQQGADDRNRATINVQSKKH